MIKFIKVYLKRFDFLVSNIRAIRRWQRLNQKNLYPSWKNLSSKANLKKENITKVLMAPSVGGHVPMFNIESLVGAALVEREADVDILLCDGVLPVCLECEHVKFSSQGLIARLIDDGPKKLCGSCFKPAEKSIFNSALKLRKYSEQIKEEDSLKAREISLDIPYDDIQDFTHKQIKIGEHAYAGALRFFGRGSFDGVKQSEPVLRRYLEAALLTATVTQRLIDKYNYDVVVLNHGIYIPQGIIADVARKNNVRVVTWNPGYKKGGFLFSHGDTYHHTMMSEPSSSWENMRWDKRHEEEITKYLKSRWVGAQDWIKFHKDPNLDKKAIEDQLGIDFTKPCIGLLTNVIWDAQLHYPANAFESMTDWIIDTIQFFIKNPHLQLLIRVHPAEITGGVPSKEKVVDVINTEFDSLPNNIFVIPPESTLSTYVAMEQCDSVLIFGTKSGIELTSSGIPVIVAGEAWIRGKGITTDVSDRDHYQEQLLNLPLNKRLSAETILRAKKYAYHFFYRRMIPIKSVDPIPDWRMFKVNIESSKDLQEGNDLGLDIICNGIINNEQFIFPAEDFI
tara:strand:- start:17145 stop:18839 length:1695 start_codon:yes stop_codon:yes gene_type:complete